MDPEKAHNITEMFLKTARRCPLFFNWMTKEYFVSDEKLNQKIWNLEFKNPIGSAGGFDKNANIIQALPSFGFAWGEVGAITPKPQEGNEKPRVWRHIEEEAIQNAFGFNNDGVLEISSRLENIYPFILPIGANIGKNKATSEEDAINDYKVLVEKLRDRVDFFVINVSSPNTPNLRDLLNREFIENIFKELKALTSKPILIKFSPDMEIEDITNLARISVDSGCDGIIATNTTVDYSVVKNPALKGGISGKVLTEKSFKVFEAIAKEVYGETILISVGGINSPEEAYRRIKAGANLVQVYSAFLYNGPELIRDINDKLIEFLQNDGFNDISEAVGYDRRNPEAKEIVEEVESEVVEEKIEEISETTENSSTEETKTESQEENKN
jgi:dihydroorotate dehydrogenase